MLGTLIRNLAAVHSISMVFGEYHAPGTDSFGQFQFSPAPIIGTSGTPSERFTGLMDQQDGNGVISGQYGCSPPPIIYMNLPYGYQPSPPPMSPPPLIQSQPPIYPYPLSIAASNAPLENLTNKFYRFAEAATVIGFGAIIIWVVKLILGPNLKLLASQLKQRMDMGNDYRLDRMTSEIARAINDFPATILKAEKTSVK